MRIKRALISVSDKTGIIKFAGELNKLGIEIISTGGTYEILSKNQIPVRKIDQITGFREILNGRIKTIHPKIHAGILAVRDNEEHMRELEKLNIDTIDMVVVNLYPFDKKVKEGGISTPDKATELIDIGGPSLLRAAAKNFKYVTAVVNPKRYDKIIDELKSNDGEISERTRLELALEVFQHTAIYDLHIANYFEHLAGKSKKDNPLPETLTIIVRKATDLRYGENPHQRGALYGNFFDFFEQLHGKELSFNNIIDINSAALIVSEFDEPSCAIVKHTNPCGVAIGRNTLEAYKKAFSTDTASSFGGIVAFNREVDIETAQEVDKIFTEIIIAPNFSNDAIDLLKRKKNRRLIKQKKSLIKSLKDELDIRKVTGGFVVQNLNSASENMRIVTRRKPTEEEMKALIFAWKVVKHVKSNAIVYATEDRTLGIGAGQMSRVDASKIAVMKAREMGHKLNGSVVASDAFFPFPDGLLEAAKAGATAVIQPGGSIRDNDIIKIADENNIAMVFTGIRYFKH